MRDIYSLNMDSERKSEISPEELEDDEDDLFYSDEEWDEDCYEDDEPEEREYCD